MYIKGVKLTKYEMVKYIEKNADGYNDIEEKVLNNGGNLYIFTSGIQNGGLDDISKFKEDGGFSDLNRYIPPERIEISECDANVKIVLPDSVTFVYHTTVIVDGENVNLGKK